MGCIPSKSNYNNISSKKGKRTKEKKLADLESTMRDGKWINMCLYVDIRPHKTLQHTSHPEPDVSVPKQTKENESRTSVLEMAWMYIMNRGSTIDGIKELTSMTLDSDMSLKERIQQPAGVSLDQ